MLSLLLNQSELLVSNEDLEKHQLTLIKEIGRGGFSVVYLVESTKYRAQFVLKATKIDLSAMNTESITAEIDSLKALYHPHIIKLYDYFFENSVSFALLEYCPNRSLEEYIITNGPLKLKMFIFFARQIVSALEKCHLKNIAHRDIKPQNILIDAMGNLKLADFGLSGFYQNGQNTRSIAGSIRYMPPELIKKETSDPFKGDIWSLGVTFYFMLVGQTPWESGAESNVKIQIMNCDYSFPSTIKRRVCVFITTMLAQSQTERPTCTMILDKLDKLDNNIGFLNLSEQTAQTARKEITKGLPCNAHTGASSSRPDFGVKAYKTPLFKNSLIVSGRKMSVMGSMNLRSSRPSSCCIDGDIADCR